MHSSKVYERLRENVGIDDHLALLNVILTKVIHNLKARPAAAPPCHAASPAASAAPSTGCPPSHGLAAWITGWGHRCSWLLPSGLVQVTQ